MRRFFSLLAFISITTAVEAQQWTPWAGLTADAASRRCWTGVSGEIFAPLSQSCDRSITFAYARATQYDRRHLADASVGAGFRYVLGDTAIVGVNAFYDGLSTSSKNWYHYAGVGGELFLGCFDFHLNYRVPFGRRFHTVGSSPFLIGTQIIQSEVFAETQLQGDERSRWTFDGEIGWRTCLPLGPIHHGRVYGGGQFTHTHQRELASCDSANVGYVGVELYNREIQNTPVQFTLGGRYQIHSGGSSEAVGYLAIRVPLGRGCLKGCGCRTALLSRMSDPVIRRIRPLAHRRDGDVILEPLTTTEYPVDGIWVAYQADNNNLQTQIDLAQAAGGSNTMIFTDGDFTGKAFILHDGQVLAGGNADLNSLGVITGVAVPWGHWGHFTRDPAHITATDANAVVLTVGEGSAVDTAHFTGGRIGIANTPTTGHQILRHILIDGYSGVSTAAGIRLASSVDPLLQDIDIEAGGVGFGGIVLNGCVGANLQGITTDHSRGGNSFSFCLNTTMNGFVSNLDGGNSWTVADSGYTILTNGLINNDGFDAVSVGRSHDTACSFITINNAVSDGFFFGTNGGYNYITNCEVNGYLARGIQIGGSAHSTFTGATLNMNITNVVVNSNGLSSAPTGSLLMQVSASGDVENVAVNNYVLNTDFATDHGFEFRLTNSASTTLNVSGTNNIIMPPAIGFLVDPGLLGTIVGHITYNGSLLAPP